MKIYLVVEPLGRGFILHSIFQNKRDAEAYAKACEAYVDLQIQSWTVHDHY